MVCMNSSTKIEKVVVWVVYSWNVCIIIFYESKIWLFALYENSSYHSNKNGCFSCSEQGGEDGGWGGGFCLGQVETPVFSVALAPSRDFLVLNGPNMAGLCDRKIEEDKTDLMLWLDFNKILKILIGDENM